MFTVACWIASGTTAVLQDNPLSTRNEFIIYNYTLHCNSCLKFIFLLVQVYLLPAMNNCDDHYSYDHHCLWGLKTKIGFHFYLVGLGPPFFNYVDAPCTTSHFVVMPHCKQRIAQCFEPRSCDMTLQLMLCTQLGILLFCPNDSNKEPRTG